MDKLIEKNAQRPDIDLVVVGLIRDHFWCHVLKCPAEGVPLLLHRVIETFFSRGLHAPAKIADLEHIVLRDQQVFWLQVSVDEAVFVQEVDPCDCLNEEIKSLGFTKHALLPDDKKQVTLLHVFEDQVNIPIIF